MRSKRAGRLAFGIFALSMMAGNAFAANLVVNSTGDDADVSLGDGLCATAFGTCTLRAAIQESNALNVAGTVTFRIAQATGTPTIRPLSDLPALVAPVVIDGWSQHGEGMTRPGIEITGAGSNAYNGLQIGAANAVVQGVIVNGFRGHGVIVNFGSLRGSWIGTDATGLVAIPNDDSSVVVGHSAAIGGVGTTVPCTGYCNVIAGNRRDGIEVVGTGSVIAGNAIGVGRDGTTPLGNGRNGVRVSVPITFPITSLTIGLANYGNIIANHRYAGVALAESEGTSPYNVAIRYNTIRDNGTNAVELGASGVPLNDDNDSDLGANRRLNRPVLESAVYDAVACGLRVRGRTGKSTHLDFYISDNETQTSVFTWLSSATQGSAADAWNVLAPYTEIAGVGQDNAAWGFEFVVPMRGAATHIAALAVDNSGNTSTVSLPVAVTGAVDLDSDDDGLPDAIECAIGSDPLNPDSDGDGFLDGEEYGDGLSPRDSDGDGVIDILDSDDDGDGVLTVDEVLHVNGGPIDLDGDGLPYWLDTDSDGDGLPDFLEYTQASVDIDGDGHPNFNDVDSDGDGLCDTPRVRSSDCVGGEDANVNGVVDAVETSPWLSDSDGDGVCDGPGCATSPMDNCPLVANPSQVDSDGNGIGDACDCADGQCPSNVIQCYIDNDGDGVTGTPRVFVGAVCAGAAGAGTRVSAISEGDCNDNDPMIHPGAQEICDGSDNNCSGFIDGEDVQLWNADPGVTGALAQRFYVDMDNDGCGFLGQTRYACNPSEPGISENSLDLDDTDGICCGNGVVELGEACDGLNNGGVTCPAGTDGVPLCQNHPYNGLGDGSCTLLSVPAGCYTTRVCYADDDGDGYTGSRRDIPITEACASYQSGPANTPWTDTSDGDCNDWPASACAAAVYPGAAEICDGCDNDCDFMTADGQDEAWFGASCVPDTEELCYEYVYTCGATHAQECVVRSGSPTPVTYYADADDDECGDVSSSLVLCTGDDAPEGYVTNAIDLDDSDGICCGNARVDGDEECDTTPLDCAGIEDGLEGYAECSSSCTVDVSTCFESLCGNGVVDHDDGESCDPQDTSSDVECRANCTYCGDFVIQMASGETCELNESRCRPGSCTYCGDGVVQRDAGEECEFTSEDNRPCVYGETSCTRCSRACFVQVHTPIFCGDGVVQAEHGETCDGGENCSDTCGPVDSKGDSGCGCSSSGGISSWLMACAVAGILLLLTRRRVRVQR